MNVSTADDRHALDRLLDAHAERAPASPAASAVDRAAESVKHAATAQLCAVALPVLRQAVASIMRGEYSARVEDDTADDAQPELSLTMRPGAVGDANTAATPFRHTSALRLRPTGAGTVDVCYEIPGDAADGASREAHAGTLASPVDEAGVRAAVYAFVDAVLRRG